ncbi:MAG TPA: FtsX-like permease family protein [Cyclobacteriaceae bacterium]|nr:FtsX-like permease family protein [Cyclobacteriaceae bacterium]
MIPRLPLKLLKRFCKPEYHIDVEGDLIEMYEERVTMLGRRRANFLLWRDVILLFRPGMIRPFFEQHTHSNMSVVRHNILISFRSFRRRKTAFFINLGSLSTGLTCALLIYTWIASELSMDKFHENDERIFRVRANYPSPTGINTIDYTPSPLAEAMVAEVPGIERAVSMAPMGSGIVTYGTKDVPAEGFFASIDFFRVFSYKLLHGDNTGLVVSKSLATKLFGNEIEAIGKVVDWTHPMRLQGPFAISGVFDDVPASSTWHFDIIFPYDKLAEGDRYSTQWNSSYAFTSLLLRADTDIEALNKKIAGFVISKDPGTKGELFVSRYSDKYLYDEGRIAYVKLFSLVAIFTLAIACINFVNLSTAQASRKIKEIGVKKALGVKRSTLIGQFLTESVIMSCLSLMIAAGVSLLFLPYFNELTGKQLTLDLDLKPVAFVLVIGILAGSYPAFFLSAFRPAEVLKGKLINNSGSEVLARKGLVILQFAISIVFITAFMIVNRQIAFVQTRNLGYSKDNIISFFWRGEFDAMKFESFVQEIKNIPGVLSASNMGGSILNRNYSLHNGFTWEGQVGNEKLISFPSPTISHGLIETLGIELKEGRTFSKDFQGEDTKMIVNEAAVKMMGFTDPVGKTVHYGTDRKEIVGVVKDFQFGSLHTELRPVFFMYAPFRRDILIRLEPTFDQRTLERVQAVYHKYVPKYPFDFTFVDEDYNRLYESEIRVSSLSAWFAAVATLISCIGLFGLAVFSCERKMKEIGVRKVLGASSMNIVRLLASDIIAPVFISILIAVPISYFIAANWLDGFAFRIELSWWFFVLSAGAALLVTWITVALQTYRAARANPVNSLKVE